jgi:hypothetical protein
MTRSTEEQEYLNEKTAYQMIAGIQLQRQSGTPPSKNAEAPAQTSTTPPARRSDNDTRDGRGRTS